jgi:hypothetical protein
MARLFLTDSWIAVDIETNGPVLGTALESENAESILRCAVLMALSALAEGGSWPTALLEYMGRFMSTMRNEVHSERLM